MEEKKAHHERILDIVVEKDEVTWQNLIYELVKQESMNPWDVDVALLSRCYLQMLKKLKEMDLRVSGKVLLAAAILLKMKSQKLLSDDIGELDRLMNPEEELSLDEFYDDLEAKTPRQEEIPSLIPRTPQPRKRKVSIYDLMLALQKALEVRDRRILRRVPSVRLEVPQKKLDITKLITDVYHRIRNFFSTSKEALTFATLTYEMDRAAKIHNFIALLHLANVDNRKIDLVQKEHFGDIEIVEAHPDASGAHSNTPKDSI